MHTEANVSLTEQIETVLAIWGRKQPPDPGMTRDEYDAERASNVLDILSDADEMRREQMRRGVPASMPIERVEQARRNIERVRKGWRWS